MPGLYTRYRDVPIFTRDANYVVDVSWLFLEKTLADFAESAALDLDPDFQRAHVWTEAQQVAFIEFKLRRGMGSSEIRWNCPGWPRIRDDARLELVDGKQRLEAVRRFLRGDIPAFGTYAHEFTDQLHFIHARFQFAINNLETRAEVLQWYLDINAGGVVHTDDEIAKVRRLLAAERGE